MILDKWTHRSSFSIKQPRWHDRVVLLAKNRIGEHNEVVFTEAVSMGTKPYYISGKAVKKCPLTSNGIIQCYAVPLGSLELLEISEKSPHDIW